MNNEILYLCDKKPGACGFIDRHGFAECQSKVCKHTTRVDHAKNAVGRFEILNYGSRVLLREVDDHE